MPYRGKKSPVAAGAWGAAAEGVHLAPLVKLHDLPVKGLLVILIFLLNFLDLRLQLLHLLHLLLALVRQGGEDDLEEDGQDNDIEAIVARKCVGEVEYLQNRDGDKVQPAIPGS